jgi:putative redox protein
VIEAKETDIPYRTSFTNGKFEAGSDTTTEKGGQGAGFRPHELLEAALACCINMWLRTYANNHDIPLDEVTTTVWLKPDKPGETRFEYRIELHGLLTDKQRSSLLEVAGTCPVRRSLSQKLSFRSHTTLDESQDGDPNGYNSYLE